MKTIFIMADSFRRDHLGTYGNQWIHTPHLDRLAKESAVFEKAYIGAFPTGPTRRDLLLGLGDPGHPFNRWKPIEPEEVTLTERLAEKRVPSMLVTDTANMVTGRMNQYKGFTAWAINRGQEGDPCWMDAGVPLEYPIEPHLIRYTADRWQQVLTNRAHRRVETDWFAPGTYKIAVEWLERNYRREDFFLWIDTFDPHEPWDPPQHYVDLYDPGYKGRVFDAPSYGLRKALGMSGPELKQLRARYAGEATMVDACVGRLLATLERLGIRDEVMIVFTSDHGTYFDYPGDNGLICKAWVVGGNGLLMSAGERAGPPLRHFPFFPGVARIPLMIQMPGQKKGRRIRGIVQPWDVSATVLDAFGIAAPPELLGSSLLPLLEGGRAKGREVAILGTNEMAETMNDRWLYATWRGQRKPALFDMQADPPIRQNLASKLPDVANRFHRKIVKFMEDQGLDQETIESFVPVVR